MSKKLVYGFGINDADYAVSPRVNGKQAHCRYHLKWFDMVRRCYSAQYHEKYPTYIGCSVCDEWIYFSKFKAWMETQDWEGKQLDKDFLVEENKMYSPDTCVFVDQKVNTFVTDSGAKRGEWPLGVCFHRKAGKFNATCRNPFTKKQEHLGLFTDPNQAHLAWKKRKHELACQLADSEYVTDERVATALRGRYL